MARQPIEFMKLITKIKMSCLNLDIHKLKEVVVGHMNPKWDSYYSMVLALMKG
jgi:hypothetical protein